MKKAHRLPAQNVVNAVLGLAALALGVYIVLVGASDGRLLVAFLVLSFVLGMLMTLPIGGADMPVVISLLQRLHGPRGRLRGLRARAIPALIIAGMVVGAAGHPADPAHGQGHEPLARQRHLQAVRARPAAAPPSRAA